MNKGFYLKLALSNLRRNRKFYAPYLLASVVTVAMCYIILALNSGHMLDGMRGETIMRSYMALGGVVVLIFAAIFLFYTNSFLTKRRRHEFGLYNILGLEKRHITKIILLETLYTYVITMALGVLLGILLDKLMYLILAKMLGGALPIGFYVSWSGIMKSLSLFGVIFLLILLNSVRQIYKSKPVELLRSDNMGEREPKAKWIFAVLGIICLGTGYYIAVTTTNPVAAFAMFFVAVILVIIGTYLIFTAGSIALLKLLRKNKGYYYKTKHFISVSSMMYRMKRNAVGLANICILSTMVLVMVSAVLSINVGLKDSLQQRYPEEFTMTSLADDPLNDDVTDILLNSMENNGLEPKNEVYYDDFSISAVYEEDEDRFVTDIDSYGGLSGIRAYSKIHTLVFVTLEDYNRCMKSWKAPAMSSSTRRIRSKLTISISSVWIFT